MNTPSIASRAWLLLSGLMIGFGLGGMLAGYSLAWTTAAAGFVMALIPWSKP